MNHYPHHVGDFNSATRHLTRVERSLYRDLLDLYYDTEKPLNSDFERLARRVVCDDCDKPALVIVLEEFFVLQEDGWHNGRCDAEIAKYQGQVEQASRAGRASAAKRSNQAQPSGLNDGGTGVDQPSDADSTTVERPFNDRTTNQNQNQNQVKEITNVISKKSKSAIPEDFRPDAAGVSAAAGLDLAATLANFRNHHVAKGSKLEDWQAAWLSWLPMAHQIARSAPGGAKAQVSDVWHESAAGIAAKAAELGLKPRNEVMETHPVFKARVMAAALVPA